ncbi:MAG TPA: hypothetical protein VK621_26925 [Bradyrhizobium sp.]|nr:hypothetical protein [Bradyrhizobium sp.]
MNAISKKTPARQKMQNPIGLAADLRPVRRNRQSVLVLGKGRIADIVVALPQVVGGDLIPALDFLSQTIGLLRRKFRVAISGTIGFRPFDCAFRD